MGGAKDLIHEIHAEIDKLEAGAADRLRALVNKLTGHVSEIEAEAKTDAEHVVSDAKAAAMPVVAEAERDAATVAEHAVADVKNAATTSAETPA